MLEFVTFFFGLITGPQIVEVSGSETVAVVELRLDGQAVGVPQERPWKFTVDFGPALKPHLLEAVGWDGRGKEIGRTQQYLNLPRSRAELRIVLGETEANGSRKGRLVWWSADGSRPERVAVSLAGSSLAIEGGRGFVLPPIPEGEEVRILDAEADFPGGQTAYATLLFGGKFRDRTGADLTAVPVAVEPEQTLPPVEQLAGWLRKQGQPLEVMAVDDRRAEVIFVRDVRTWGALQEMGRRFDRQPTRLVGTLGENRTVRLLDAFEQPREGEALGARHTLALFPLSQPFTEGHGGIPLVVGTYYRKHPAETQRGRRKNAEQRLADAVATAALSVAGSQGGRAVVLVLGDQPEDKSQWSAAKVRELLQALRVPLFVWTTAPASVREKWPAETAAWGEATEILDMPPYMGAIGALDRALDHQRVIWVEGRHFLHQIELSPAARGVRLVE